MSTVHTTGEPTAIGANDRELEAGDVVGEYVVRDLLGKGGFGTVYRAQHPVIGKLVAIKVLSRRYSSDRDVVSRFAAEAKAVNQIRHRNIIDIFAFGQLTDGRHYYVMEYVDGTPLDRYLYEQGILRLENALPILRPIARALDAAHAKGIAHRDLKPENIVISFDDEGQMFPKLLDFGIAKLTQPEQEQAHRTGTGVPLGTPYYMSPEQCRGRDVDHRTDIYSFGVMTFRLLTGEYPFTGELIEILHKHMHEEPPRASSKNPYLTPEIDAAIAWMLQKEPGARPPTVMGAVVALQGESAAPTPMLTPSAIRTPLGGMRDPSVQTADTLAAATGDTMAAVTASPPRRSNSRPVWIGSVIVLVGGLAAVVALQVRTKSSVEPPAARTSAPPPTALVAAPPTETPKVEPPMPDAGLPPPEVAANVVIKLTGAPPGAVVKRGPQEIGIAPDFELPRGTAKVVLMLHASGYHPTSFTVVPEREQTVAVTMKKKQTSGGTKPRDKDAVFNANDIPGLTK